MLDMRAEIILDFLARRIVMAIVRFDPIREVAQLQNHLSRVINKRVWPAHDRGSERLFK
jgi:hypothetical protein